MCTPPELGRRHRDDLVAAVGAAHRHALDDLVVLQVGRGDQAAVRLAPRRRWPRRSGRRRTPSRRRGRSARGSCARSGLRRMSPVTRHACRRGRTPCACRPRRRGGRARPRTAPASVSPTGKPLLASAHRRRDQRGALHRAVVLERVREAGHGARHADRGLREQRLVRRRRCRRRPGTCCAWRRRAPSRGSRSRCPCPSCRRAGS